MNKSVCLSSVQLDRIIIRKISDISMFGRYSARSLLCQTGREGTVEHHLDQGTCRQIVKPIQTYSLTKHRRHRGQESPCISQAIIKNHALRIKSSSKTVVAIIRTAPNDCLFIRSSEATALAEQETSSSLHNPTDL